MDNPDDSDHVVVLLPCPFCGSTFTGKGGNYWECHDCFASGPTVDWDEPLQGDEFDKASAMQWNRRQTSELVEAADQAKKSADIMAAALRKIAGVCFGWDGSCGVEQIANDALHEAGYDAD